MKHGMQDTMKERRMGELKEKCPFCTTGKMKVLNFRENPNPVIDDACDIMCSDCNISLCLAVKKGDTAENVWTKYVKYLRRYRWK